MENLSRSDVSWKVAFVLPARQRGRGDGYDLAQDLQDRISPTTLKGKKWAIRMFRDLISC